MSNRNNIPSKQRALVLQGGGALGAYQAGAVQALYERLSAKENKQGGLFDIVAGTSSGAMNGAILVSHVSNGSWQKSIDKLNAFWEYVKDTPDLRYWFPYIPDKESWISYWDMQKRMYPDSASGEQARRYYSTKQFLCSGVQHIYTKVFYAMPTIKWISNLR